MTWLTRILLLAIAAAFVWQAPIQADEQAGQAGIEFFEKKIRPVLVEHCYQCHSALSKEVKGKLRVDYRDGLRSGGESGPAVVPGKPGESLLLAALRHDGLEMPPEEKLPRKVADDFQTWIEMGAPDPRDQPANPEQAEQVANADRFEQLREWWSLQPVARQAPPTTRNQTWPATEIDRFILAPLEAQSLSPAPCADRTDLLRRLSYTLRGLPPSPEETASFLAEEDTEDSWARLVDRLLASPHFGEHFARHWMDVVRYSDTYGYEWDIPAKGAWRYRDYLVRAFNADVPVDQLFREHIAGDLLPEPRTNTVDLVNESLIGPMFFQLGEKRHGDSSEFDGIHQEMLDNKIDAVSKAFLALTVSCARCHDHKIDPVLQAEYYALGGLFMSSRWVANTVDLPQRHAEQRRELSELKKRLRTELGKQWTGELSGLSAKTLMERSKTADGKLPPLENVFHPWLKLQETAAASGNLAEAWQTLAQQYQNEQTTRAQKNAADFVLVADFRQGVPTGWSVDGVGLRDITPCGDFTVALQGETVVDQILLGGLVTHTFSPRMNGALRTPYLNTFEPGHLSFEVSGGDFSARRAVIDNAFLTEKQQYLTSRSPQWQTADTFPAMRQRHIYLEFATKSSNPNFPPRVGLGGECSEQQVADPRSWFAVSRVVRHQSPGTPADELTRFAALFKDEPVTTLDEAAQRYAGWLSGAVHNWMHEKATDDDVRLLSAALEQGLVSNQADDQSALGLLRQKYRASEQSLPEPWTVNGMADIDQGFDLPLNRRGEYDQLGEIVPRGSISALRETLPPIAERSGRLQLAEQIASDTNPLTARVFVNRVWQWLFGAGLVTTSNDFGHLGTRPSHPELLDHLAARFVEQQWSTKQLVREIVLSETWRQSSLPSAESRNVDPANRWLSHYPLRRLPAEGIRDAMLAVSGRLQQQLYGPPIDPPRQNEDAQKRLFSGPLDGLGRRSLYTKATIMEPPRFLAVFNQPPPKISTGVRDVTSTPAQSLTLLNDPFVSQQAENWAKQLVLEPHSSIAGRLESMFLTAFARPATQEEIDRWSAFTQDSASAHGVAAAESLSSVAVWKEVAHAIFNAKEFIYTR